MKKEYREIRNRGKVLLIPSVQICDRHVVAQGKWLKIAFIADEELIEDDVIPDPPRFIASLKTSGYSADILTFRQRIDEQQPRHDYPIEWDNAAVARTDDYDKWWKSLPQETRKNVRRAAKRGIVVRVVDFNDALVKGIKAIFDESPLRQGMRFWHFGKDHETIKSEQGKHANRSEFLGAYYGDELVGFLKYTYVGRFAKIMQILSLSSHYDKRPMNALIAKAVEVCHEKGMVGLIYSKLTFGNKRSSALAEFKRRNGFEPILYPRYYVPLTLKGRIAILLKLHRGMLGLLPPWLIAFLLRWRSRLFALGRNVSIAGTSPGSFHGAQSVER